MAVSTRTVTIRSTPGLREKLGDLPREISGAKGQTFLFRLFWGTFTKTLFTKISESYETRSEGGTDDLGNRFEPLSRHTVAYRPIRRGEATQFGFRNVRDTRGLLTAKQDQTWRAIFVSRLKRLSDRMNSDAAKQEAARIAWSILKSQGAQTRLDVLGGRDVRILRVSDRLFESFLPGRVSGGNYIPRRDQIYRLDPGILTIGSRVPYAAEVMERRNIIPDNIDPWIDEAMNDALNAIIERIQG